MQPGEDNRVQVKQLEKEIEKLRQDLGRELKLNRVLHCAVEGSFGSCQSCSCLSSALPVKVKVLLSELALVEEEIDWLERNIDALKMDFFQEKMHIKELLTMKQVKELNPLFERMRPQLKKLPYRRLNQIELPDCEISVASQHKGRRKNRTPVERRASLGSSTELQSAIFAGTNGTEENENARCPKSHPVQYRSDKESEIANPNKLATELIKCLTGIFLNLNKAQCKKKGSANHHKHALTCANSKVIVSKAAFSCRTHVFPFNNNASHHDPYGTVHDPEFVVRDVGPYKNFIQITKSSVDASRLSECLPAMQRLRVLMQKLSKINIAYMTHKQKLAFWINVYNACIMNAFLQNELPPTPEKHIDLMNKATINVGGIMLHAFTIEHFILRHPVEVKRELKDKKTLFLPHACGLGYPEPNVIFALCRGSWSSPALNLYTQDQVMNELEKAKVEYLEASIGITSKKKILVPKLMHWHMTDFAGDMESLIEWIYSQLPHSSSLKRLIMECLNGEPQSPQKAVEIQPYESEFRYLLPVL